MKIALLSGASPRSCKHGPAVRLVPGSWRLNVHGIIDSSILMHVEGYEASNVIHHGMELPELRETAVVQLSFGVRGSEQYITVIAEKVA